MKISHLCLGLAPCLVYACHGADYLPLGTPKAGRGGDLLDRGLLHFWPRLATGLTYDDNITLQKTNSLSDLIGVVLPGMSVVLGETADTLSGAPSVMQSGGYPTPDSITAASRGLSLSSIGLSLDYGARISLYTENSDYNAVDHVGRLNAVLPGERFSVQLMQDLQSLAETTVEIGTRDRSKSYQSSLGATYELSELTSLGLSANYLVRQVEGGIGNTTLSSELHGDYRLAERARVGLAVTGGRQDPDNSPAQVFEQVRARFGYDVTDLVRLDGSVGLEWRQYDTGASSAALPVFDLNASYAPTERTRFGVRGSRGVQSSAFLTGENYVNSLVGVSLSQALGVRLNCRASLDYNMIDYSSVQTGSSSGRTDNLWTAVVQADVALPRRFSLSAFYRYRKNDTSVATVGYSNNQVGFFLAWAY